MTTLNSNTIVSLVDTSDMSGSILLPLTTDIPYRTLFFKDSAGSFNTNNLQLSTTGLDVLENGLSTMNLTNSNQAIGIYADPENNKWRTLFSYNTADHASNWSLYPATTNLNLSNYEIINVTQTNTLSSVATNLVVSQSYSSIIDIAVFNPSSFTQLLTSLPTSLYYKNTNSAFSLNLWQTTFSFSGALASNDNRYAYYFSLSNVTQNFETTGQNFNFNTPKCIIPTFTNPLFVSDSYTDAYNLSSWVNDDNYCVLLYFLGASACNTFDPIALPCFYTLFMQPSIQYGF